MDELYESVKLRSTSSLITEAAEEHFDGILVCSGAVRVFVAWIKDNDRLSRRVLLTELSAGDYIPGFSAWDVDENGEPIRWCFILETTGEAELHLMRGLGTSVMQRKFVKEVEREALQRDCGRGFRDFYENEGRDFTRAIKEYYRREELRAAAVIFKGEMRAVRDSRDATHVFAHIFDQDVAVTGDDPCYRAVAYACIKSGIEVKEIDEIMSACGKEITPPRIASASQFACRSVVLDTDWYKKDCGTIVSTLDGAPVSCVPKGSESYIIYNGETQEAVPLTKETAERIDPKAYVLGRTLPSRKLTKKDLLRFGLKSIRRADLLLMIGMALISALIGILVPTLNQKIYDEYIPLGDKSQLVQICIVIASFMLGCLFVDMVKNLTDHRISSHVGYDLQNAVYYRIFQLPESFFRRFDSADLAQRLEYASTIAESWTNTLVISGMTSVFGLLYLFKMIRYSGKLTAFSLLMILVYAAGTLLFGLRTMKFDAQAEEKKGEANSKLYQFLNGVEKIRMAGAEDKAANEFLGSYAALQNIELRRDKLSAATSALGGAATTAFSMVFYYLIVKNNLKISTGAFMAFNSAFGTFSGIVLETIGNLLGLYQLKPMYERFRPIVETATEDDGRGKIPETLRGAVSVKNVSFSYDGTTDVLQGINLDIRPGEYVGIVGESGCGKSTLLKLLLGFETPKQGSISYDDMDLKTLDKRALRKKLGVVLQNGRLIAGNILENITITAPRATIKDVNRVIEQVGLKDDIERMPMGIRTVLGESCGTISGGQQQRILIARAIIGGPSILIFDEATSALDNRTQAEVCKSLEEMKITRIAVAHRLSTIRNCDKIIVIDKGRVVEQGDYDSLMAQKGKFYSLAVRQIG